MPLTWLQPCFASSVSAEAHGVIQQSPDAMCAKPTAGLIEHKKAIKRLLTYFIVRPCELVSLLIMAFCQVLGTSGDKLSMLIELSELALSLLVSSHFPRYLTCATCNPIKRLQYLSSADQPLRLKWAAGHRRCFTDAAAPLSAPLSLDVTGI